MSPVIVARRDVTMRWQCCHLQITRCIFGKAFRSFIPLHKQIRDELAGYNASPPEWLPSRPRCPCLLSSSPWSEQHAQHEEHETSMSTNGTKNITLVCASAGRGSLILSDHHMKAEREVESGQHCHHTFQRSPSDLKSLLTLTCLHRLAAANLASSVHLHTVITFAGLRSQRLQHATTYLPHSLHVDRATK